MCKSPQDSACSNCPSAPFFFGSRGFGKSTWLRQALPNAAFFDLLDAALYLQLSHIPMT